MNTSSTENSSFLPALSNNLAEIGNFGRKAWVDFFVGFDQKVSLLSPAPVRRLG